ncbi:radical SAM protein [Candidatus Woesearchaeota archaeon]|nr:radical SAM protein [Candidatus Woesearchaeota archaeon]
MVIFKFRNLKFFEEDAGIGVIFMNYFNFYISKKELEQIGRFRVKKSHIEFISAKKTAEKKFFFLLERKFTALKSIFDNKPCLYVHKNSGIPLIGSNEFGIVDRATNMIELKPITLCNLDCIYCSVARNKRVLDIVVEEEYLIDELKKIVELKKNRVNIHIGGQGDPTLYSELLNLVKDLRKIKKIRHISMATNGVLLNKANIDSLIRAGITHFHISLNSMTVKRADYISDRKYPLKKVINSCRYIAENSNLVIAPVYIPSINDNDIEELIKFSKEIDSPILIQNFLEYRFGKKPVNAISMKFFFQKLKYLEKKYNLNLTGLNEPEIKPDTALAKPFRKRDIISVDILSNARIRNTKIGVADNRVVTVINCFKNRKIKVRIIRDKDNIYIAKPLNE